jgi:tagatose-1,6-bisphosphate aldolase
VVVETARRLVVPGVDVLKAEFPLDITAEPQERIWAEACSELTAASPVPWVLLSASVDFETFLRMLTVACQSGASGVAVGRAVWQEAAGLTGEKRLAFLR